MSEDYESPYKSKLTYNRIWNATKYSFQGFRSAFKFEASFCQEFLIACFMCPLAFVLGRTPIEVIVLLFTLFLVLIVELLNSALEALGDRIINDYDEMIKRAKDLGSAAIFLCLVFSFFTWLYFVIRYFANWS